MTARWAALLVAGAFVLGACGGDDDAEGDAVDVTLADGGDDAVSTDASSDDATGADDGASGDTTADSLVIDDGASADGDVVVTGDPALFALTQLSTDEVCAMFPKADVESIVGVSVADPSGMNIPSLGTNCLYNDAATFDLVAKLEFSVFDWNTVVGLTSFQPEGAPETEECDVAGRPALCTPAYEVDGFATGAQVYVKLGGDGDIVLFTESSLGLDQAMQLAELAATHLPT